MKTPLSVAVAQLDCVVGDISGNARRILDAVARAKAAGADVLLTPELALCGYPPEDLLLRPAFLQACAEELDALAAQVGGTIGVICPPSLKAEVQLFAMRDPRLAAFEDRIIVVTALQAKGLEYDGVLVVSPDAIVAEAPGGARVLYVALTRATQRMVTLDVHTQAWHALLAPTAR